MLIPKIGEYAREEAVDRTRIDYQGDSIDFAGGEGGKINF